eukprot:scaffold2164_cov132-Ochromonas_danica.AAC.3
MNPVDGSAGDLAFAFHTSRAESGARRAARWPARRAVGRGRPAHRSKGRTPGRRTATITLTPTGRKGGPHTVHPRFLASSSEHASEQTWTAGMEGVDGRRVGSGRGGRATPFAHVQQDVCQTAQHFHGEEVCAHRHENGVRARQQGRVQGAAAGVQVQDDHVRVDCVGRAADAAVGHRAGVVSHQGRVPSVEALVAGHEEHASARVPGRRLDGLHAAFGFGPGDVDHVHGTRPSEQVRVCQRPHLLVQRGRIARIAQLVLLRPPQENVVRMLPQVEAVQTLVALQLALQQPGRQGALRIAVAQQHAASLRSELEGQRGRGRGLAHAAHGCINRQDQAGGQAAGGQAAGGQPAPPTPLPGKRV